MHGQATFQEVAQEQVNGACLGKSSGSQGASFEGHEQSAWRSWATSKHSSLAEGSQSTRNFPTGLTPSMTALCHSWSEPALA